MEDINGSEPREVLHELRLAVIRGDLQTIRDIIAKGINVNQPLKGGWSALMYACSMGHPGVVEYLLQQGANPNCHKDLFTPLMAACASTQGDEYRLVQCVNLLLQYKANVITAERHHVSALMFAAKEGHSKVVAQLLTNYNSDINAQDSQGWTALFWAVNQGRRDVVELLLGHGARADLPDKQGQTALDLARNKQFDQIAGILLTKIGVISVLPEFGCNGTLDKMNTASGKGNNTMLQTLLDELSSSMIKNNGRCSNKFTELLNSKELENNIEVLKAHGQVISKIAHSVNDCFQNSLLMTNKLIPKPSAKKQIKKIEISWKNMPYSAVEAKDVLSSLVRQLEGLYVSMSYMRQHMQGNPPAAVVEDKFARLPEITALSSKAVLRAQQLCDEVQFFHQYAKQLEESDRVVPADFIVEQKTDTDHSAIISSCVIAAAVALILFNTKVFTLSVFIK